MGKRLECEVEHLIRDGLHSRVVEPFEKNVCIPKQLDLFDEETVSRRRKPQGDLGLFDNGVVSPVFYADNITTSTFYEMVSAALYGGTRFNRRYVKVKSGEVRVREGQPDLNGFANHEKYIQLTMPDLIDEKNHWIGEVKAFCSGRPYKIRDEQFNGYVRLQAYLPSDTSIDFIMYRHTVRDFSHTAANPNSRYTDGELFSALAENTAHSVVLPFNIIYFLHSGKSDYVYRDDGIIKNPHSDIARELRYRDPGTCLRSPCVNHILIDPEKFLTEHGFDVKDYEIERLRSPDDFYFGECSVRSFPITIVKYKRYGEWAGELRRDMEMVCKSDSFSEEINFGEHQLDFPTNSDTNAPF